MRVAYVEAVDETEADADVSAMDWRELPEVDSQTDTFIAFVDEISQIQFEQES